MPIEATEPTVVSATYPFWAFSLQTQGYPCARTGEQVPDTVSCRVSMVKFRIRDDGVPELSPLASDVRELIIPDIYALAAVKPSVALALNALMTAVAEVADDEGIR